MNLNCVASQYASFKFIAACFCCSVFPCGSKITKDYGFSIILSSHQVAHNIITHHNALWADAQCFVFVNKLSCCDIFLSRIHQVVIPLCGVERWIFFNESPLLVRKETKISSSKRSDSERCSI